MEDLNLHNNVGLINFGNTCFMNSSIQLLMSASVFCMHLISNEELLNTDAKKYIKTIKDYMHPKTSILGPKLLHSSYMKLNLLYTGYTQEDSHEYIVYTLDDILTIIKSLPSEHDDFIRRACNMVTFTLNTSVTYKKDNTVSNSSNRDCVLLLPINKQNRTLHGCLELFSNVDEQDKTITYSLSDIPKYLFISLKRFIKNGTTHEKNTDLINIPLTTEISGAKYKLKSFVNHMGSISGGHYVAYSVRKINGEYLWFCYNDSNVSPENIDNISNIAKQSYVFLYSRI